MTSGISGRHNLHAFRHREAQAWLDQGINAQIVGQALDHANVTVIRLLSTLARWTGGDAVQMRAMMSLSPLANDKWWSKRGSTDWLDHQIADAIAYTGYRT